jgi:hypothetical protein
VVVIAQLPELSGIALRARWRGGFAGGVDARQNHSQGATPRELPSASLAGSRVQDQNVPHMGTFVGLVQQTT